MSSVTKKSNKKHKPLSSIGWNALGLSTNWLEIINKISPNSTPRAVQQTAIQKNILGSVSNFIVSAPTNSGKSLVGLLALLNAISNNRRAILLEPQRALAKEKVEELERLSTSLSDSFDNKLNVKISTGDYRLENEKYTDPAPNGELIVATPERFEAIIRNPESQDWLNSIGCVCVDEAHLIADYHRGATLEYLITTLRCLESPPQIVLLSATLGNVDKAKHWLEPCEVVQVFERYPPLHKSVVELGADKKANDLIAEILEKILSENNDNQALIFVFKTRDTESLAKELTNKLGSLAGSAGVRPYHSKMTPDDRDESRRAFIGRESRVIVTTSALAMGMNLPSTHVIVRDLTYFSANNPTVGDLLQMMGRAGRGDQEGHAIAIIKPNDDWSIKSLQKALEEEQLPDFKSTFEQSDEGWGESPSPIIPQGATQITSYLSRLGEKGCRKEDIETFFARSLGAQSLVGHIGTALNWLESRTLAYEEEDKVRLTVLGTKAARSVLPLNIAYGFSQLLRDLMDLDDKDDLLRQWQVLDHLLVLDLLYDRSPSIRKFSKKLVEQVDAWAEKEGSNSPMLFRNWLRDKKDISKSTQVLDSLDIPISKKGKARHDWSFKRGYRATFNTLILAARGQGRSIGDLEKQYAIENLAGIEERWRDDMLWLLSGIANLLDIRTFYYHLIENCKADTARIKSVKRLLKKMQRQVYELMEQLKYCSALGPLIRDIQRSSHGKAGVGIQSIRKLEESGITTIRQLRELSFEEIVSKGIRRDIAKRINNYLTKRRL